MSFVRGCFIETNGDESKTDVGRQHRRVKLPLYRVARRDDRSKQTHVQLSRYVVASINDCDVRRAVSSGRCRRRRRRCCWLTHALLRLTSELPYVSPVQSPGAHISPGNGGVCVRARSVGRSVALTTTTTTTTRE